MPRLIDTTPAYRKHKSSNQAVVWLDGRDHYLGEYGTRESRRNYERMIGEWLANGRCLPVRRSGFEQADTLVNEVVIGYWKHAKTYYGPGGELTSIKLALAHLRRIYGPTPAAEFGPLALKAVRESMVRAGWCRSYVNAQVGRLKRAFKWAAEHELIPPAVWHGLQAVSGLRQGKTTAREAEPVKPVPEAYVDAVLSHVSRHVGAMIRLQLLTGMRPGEVVIMRTGDIDTTGRLWIYKPQSHKNLHRGHDRVVYLGPLAQEVIRPFLKTDLQAHMFVPAESEAERHALQRERRKTRVQPSQVKRAEKAARRTRRRKRAPGDRYDVDAYRRAIARASNTAFPPPEPLASLPRETLQAWKARLTADQRQELRQWHRDHAWHPHQLRHNAATRLRKQYGLEAAQVILGHRTLSVTEIYAEKNVAAAMRIMSEVG